VALEELAEVGGAGEAEVGCDGGGGFGAVGEEPLGLQGEALVEVVLGAEARRGLGGAGEGDTILPGHGEPTTPAIWAKLTDYVNAGRELLGDDGDAYKKAITERYPAYQGAALIDVANTYMFGPKN
jgi:hypothetical protein